MCLLASKCTQNARTNALDYTHTYIHKYTHTYIHRVLKPKARFAGQGNRITAHAVGAAVALLGIPAAVHNQRLLPAHQLAAHDYVQRRLVADQREGLCVCVCMYVCAAIMNFVYMCVLVHMISVCACHDSAHNLTPSPELPRTNQCHNSRIHVTRSV